MYYQLKINNFYKETKYTIEEINPHGDLLDFLDSIDWPNIDGAYFDKDTLSYYHIDQSKLRTFGAGLYSANWIFFCKRYYNFFQLN